MTEEQWLDALLSSRKSRAEKIREIVNYFHPEVTHTAVVCNTHVPIETVEIYSLEIGVDANGHAAVISSVDGFITE